MGKNVYKARRRTIPKHIYNTFSAENEKKQKFFATIWKKQEKFKACVRYFLSSFYFSPNYRPSQTMKNVFYFI